MKGTQEALNILFSSLPRLCNKLLSMQNTNFPNTIWFFIKVRIAGGCCSNKEPLCLSSYKGFSLDVCLRVSVGTLFPVPLSSLWASPSGAPCIWDVFGVQVEGKETWQTKTLVLKDFAGKWHTLATYVSLLNRRSWVYQCTNVYPAVGRGFTGRDWNIWKIRIWSTALTAQYFTLWVVSECVVVKVHLVLTWFSGLLGKPVNGMMGMM